MQDEVLVVDADGRSVEYVSPAIARYALKREKATVLSYEPFKIQLKSGVLRAPRPWVGVTASDGVTSTVEVVRTERQKMKTTKSWKQMLPSERAKAISDFFREERDNVWIKVTGDAQIVLNMKDGKDPISVPPIQPGDPILITKSVSYDQLKRATGDFRDFVMKGYLKLLSQEEAQTYFEEKSARVGKSAEELMLASDAKWSDPVHSAGMRIESAEPRAKVSAAQSESDTPGYNPILTRDAVKPRVQHLCRQGSTQMPAEQRKPASELLEDFIDIEDSLSEDDVNYILANTAAQGEYKTVHAWANGKLASLTI